MRKNYVGALSTAAALALVLSACGGGGASGGGNGASGGGEGGSDVQLSDINATERDQMEKGGTLRLAVTQLPEQWNYHHTNGSQQDTKDILDTMVVQLWDFDENGVPTPNENYLTDFEEEVTDGKQTVTLHLNPEAKWNSGERITWEDFAAGVQACNGEDEAFECGQTEPNEAIESVEQGETPSDVVITFKATAPDWKSTVEIPYPKTVSQDAETFNTGLMEYDAQYFTGPYVVDKIDEAQRVITLKPNPNWWGEEPMLDSITFRELEEDAKPGAFQNQEIDAYDIGASANGYSLATQTPGAVVREGVGPNWRHFTFNSTAGVLTDQNVRQAIAMGVDREAIAKSDLAGLPALQEQLGNHFYSIGQEGYQDNSGVTPFDVEAAGKKLDEAGWKLNESTGIREKDGQPLTVTFTVLQGVPTSENEGNLFQSQMKNIGVDVKIDQQPSSEFANILDEGRFEVFAFSWMGTQYPLANIGQIYGDPSKNTSNYARLNDPELNEMITEVGRETDPEKRIELANKIDTRIWENVHTLPLYQRPELVAAQDKVANYGAKGQLNPRSENWGFVAK